MSNLLKYGNILEDIEPPKNEIYDLFTNYFSNPILTKTKDIDNSSIDMVRIISGYVVYNKYLIVSVDKDENKKGTKKRLSDLSWNSLQTRMLKENIVCDSYKYAVPEGSPYTDIITKKIDTTDTAEYVHPYYPELKIVLLL